MRKRSVFILAVLHALFCSIGTLFLSNMSFIGGEEVSLFQWTLGIKRLLFKNIDTPDPNQFLFVNVAYDRQLIDKIDENGFLLGNQDITDRKKLMAFFNILNQQPYAHKFILCDIFFKDPSPDDNALLTELQTLPNLLIPYQKGEKGEYDYPLFNIASGLADYTTADTSGTFLKFRLIDGKMKTIPLLMYEQMHNAIFKKGMFLSLVNRKLSLNSIIVDFRIRYYHLLQGEFRKFYINLGELLNLPDAVVLDMVKDRIIVIGDFEKDDLHKTIYGDMPGALILLNSYLALVNEDNVISFYFLLFLLVIYFLISYNIFSEKPLKERQWVIRFLQTVKIGELLASWISYMAVMTIFSIILSLFLKLYINILFIATYLTFLQTSIQWVKKYRKRLTIKNK